MCTLWVPGAFWLPLGPADRSWPFRQCLHRAVCLPSYFDFDCFGNFASPWVGKGCRKGAGLSCVQVGFASFLCSSSVWCSRVIPAPSSSPPPTQEVLGTRAGSTHGHPCKQGAAAMCIPTPNPFGMGSHLQPRCGQSHTGSTANPRGFEDLITLLAA